MDLDKKLKEMNRTILQQQRQIQVTEEQLLFMRNSLQQQLGALKILEELKLEQAEEEKKDEKPTKQKGNKKDQS